MADSPRADRSDPGAPLGAVLLVVVALAYSPALTGGMVWDDYAHLTKPALGGWDGLARIWFEVGATQQYYPLLHSAFWVEGKLWGDAVLGYHVTNVLLHVAAAALLVSLVRGLEVRGAWLAAFLFALHPVHVESVAWISEQKNTLSLVFYLAAAVAYLRFDRGRSPRDYSMALALFVLALLTKTVTATLPAALLVVFWWKRGRIDPRRDVVPLLPWFALAAASGLFTAWVERRIIGAEGAEFDLGAVERGLLAARAVWFYLGKLLWPHDLMFTYPRWSVDASAASQWLFPLTLACLIAALWRLRVRTRAPLASLLVFGGSLFPVLGFLNIYPFRYSFVADHFQYLASIAIIVPAAATIVHLCGRAPAGWGLRAAQGAVGVALCALAGLTARQSANYRDAATLYRATLALNPESWKEHNNLGRILSRSTRTVARAIPHYEAVVRLKPDHVRAHYSLGVAYYETARPAEAAGQFQRVLELTPPTSLLAANSHLLLGVILTNTPGRLDEALAELEIAAQLKPGDAEVTTRLAEARDRLRASFRTPSAPTPPRRPSAGPTRPD